QVARDVDRPLQEIDAQRALIRSRRHESRLMLDPRIEQIPRSGFHDARKAQATQIIGHPGHFVGQPGGIGVEARVVERDRHRLVTDVGQKLQRLGPAMKRQAVRVVAELHRMDQSGRGLTMMFLYRAWLLGSCAWMAKLPLPSLFRGPSTPGGSTYSNSVLSLFFTVICCPLTMMWYVYHSLSFTGLLKSLMRLYRLPDFTGSPCV